MAVEYLDPNENVNAVWTTNSYTFIDDGIRQPTAPNTGTDETIIAYDADDYEKQSYSMSNLSGSYSEITEIKVWLYAHSNHSVGLDLNVSITVGGVEETAILISPYTTYIWYSVTFSGSWTQAEADALIINFETVAVAKGFYIDIGATYAEVTAIEGGSQINSNLSLFAKQ